MKFNQFVLNALQSYSGFDLIEWRDKNDNSSYLKRKEQIVSLIPNCNIDEISYLFDEIKMRTNNGKLPENACRAAMDMVSKAWDFHPVFGKAPANLTELILDSLFSDELGINGFSAKEPIFDYAKAREYGYDFQRDFIRQLYMDLSLVNEPMFLIEGVWQNVRDDEYNTEIAERFQDYLTALNDWCASIQAQGVEDIRGFQRMVQIVKGNTETLETIEGWDIIYLLRMTLCQNTSLPSNLTEELALSVVLRMLLTLFCEGDFPEDEREVKSTTVQQYYDNH